MGVAEEEENVEEEGKKLSVSFLAQSTFYPGV